MNKKNVRCDWQHTYEKGPLISAGIRPYLRNSSVDRRIHYTPMAGLLTYASRRTFAFSNQVQWHTESRSAITAARLYKTFTCFPFHVPADAVKHTISLFQNNTGTIILQGKNGEKFCLQDF